MEIRLDAETLVLSLTPGDRHQLFVVRGLPVRQYDKASGNWHVPYLKENYDLLREAGFPISHLSRPTKGAYRVEVYKDKLFAVYAPYSTVNKEICQHIPDTRTWVDTINAWVCRPTIANIRYLRQKLPNATWSDQAILLAEVLGETERTSREMEAAKEVVDLEINDYKFGNIKPYEHQIKAFALCRNAEAFGLFMEQGTGKTCVAVHDSCYNYMRGVIDSVLVICPNGVKDNWPEEIALHAPDGGKNHTVVVWRAGISDDEVTKLREAKGLRWLIMNVDALSTDKGMLYAKAYVQKYRASVFVDESTRIKTPSAKRTRNIVKLGQFAVRRRIMTGTPITQGPLDVYAPFKFLDPNILGYGSFTSFKNEFAILGGFNGKVVIGYTNLDKLQKLISPFNFRVLRDECLDLPPKVYQKLEIDLTPAQKKIYKDLQDAAVAELSGKQITAAIVLTKYLRLQQVIGGFAPVHDEVEFDAGGEVVKVISSTTQIQKIPGPNPKLEALLDSIEDVQGKVIVWARFRAEIAMIVEVLKEAYGENTVVEFHGGVNEENRTAGRRAFQDPNSPVRFFIGQQDAGGIGINLQLASTVYYFSNTFSLETRLQSEDRAHRIGTKHTVTYIDIVARGTIDTRRILPALRGKKNVADTLTGDKVKDWL